MNNQSDFNTPQRQSLIGVVVYLLRNARVIVSLIIVVIAVGREDPLIFTLMVAGIFAAIGLTAWISWLQYRNFTFHVENDELVIHRGVLVKDRKNIPLNRIQSVHIEQNIIQQALGVVGLKIDSAGSSEKELEIAALKEPVARAFRDLLKHKPAQSTEESSAKQETQEDAASRELVSLSPVDLLKVGLTENHIRNGLVALLVVYGYSFQYYEYVEDYLNDEFGDYMENVPAQLLRAGLALVIAAIITFIVVSIIISLIRTVLTFYNFRASIQGEVVEIRSGLLKKNEYRIPVKKIQFLKWNSNPLRKLLGFQTVRIYQAEPGKPQKKKKRVEIPACYPEQSVQLEKLVYDRKIEEGFSPVKADHLAYTRFYTMIFGIPVIIASVVQYFLYPFYWYLPLFLLPLIVFLAYKYGRSIKITFLEDLVILQKGWIFPRRTVLTYYKIQAMRFSDNVVIRRRNLAHLTFHTASGSVRLRYIDPNTVKTACDYAIYKLQTTRRSWI